MKVTVYRTTQDSYTGNNPVTIDYSDIDVFTESQNFGWVLLNKQVDGQTLFITNDRFPEKSPKYKVKE